MAPETSKLRRAARSGRPPGTNRCTATAVSRPIGTLMKRIQRQPSASVSTPPRSTPTAPPTPPIAPHAPSARLRSWPTVKTLEMIDRVAGATPAPPNPRPPEPLHAAGDDQHQLGLSEAADQRRDREQQQPGVEDVPLVEQVRGAS